MKPFALSLGRRDSLLLLAAGFALVASAAASVALRQAWAADDFFITYRYAWNLAEGRGFVFNPGEHVFGSTDPGLGLILALLHFLTRIPIEWLASILFGAALAGAAFLLLQEGTALSYRAEMAVGGGALLASSFVWAQNGAAAPLTLLMLFCSALAAERHPVAAGLLAGLAVWVRPDAGLGFASLLLLVFLGKRRIPWRFALAAATMVIVGVLCAKVYFGRFIPNTLGAKIEMAAANPESATGFEGFWGRATIPLERHFGGAWPLTLVLGLIGQWPLFQRAGLLGRLLVLYSGALALLYPMTGVPFFSWYILLPVAAVLYGIPFFFGTVIRGFVAALGGAKWLWAVGSLAGLFLVFLCLRDGLAAYSPDSFAPPERLITYKQAADWLRANSVPNDSIAYVEIGVLGYYSQRPVEDLMGLVTPRVLPYVSKNDIVGGFLTKPTTFVISHTRGRMAPIIQAEWFPSAYEEVARFKDSGFRGGTLVIYRRLPEGSLPGPPPPE